MQKILRQDGGRVAALPVCIYCDYERNIFAVQAGTERAAFGDMWALFDYLEAVQVKTFPKLAQNSPKNCPKLVCFVNGLNAFRVAALQRYPDAQEKGMKRQGKETLRLEIITDRFVFRSYDALANGAPHKAAEMFGTVNLLEAMAKLLDELAQGEPWPRLKWSLAYQAKRRFYAPIRAQLWEWMKEKNALFKSLEHYADMFAGSKSGFLLLYATAKHKKKLRQVFDGCECWDKKSAYPAVFLSDGYFPIGEIYKICQGKAEELKNAIKESRWFKIVIETKKRIPELELFEGTPDKGERRYGIEFYDWKVLTELLKVPTKRIEEILNSSYWKLYISAETAYLPLCFRDRLLQCYEEKNAIKDKSSPYRFMLKTMIDMIYGKPLQYHGFGSIKQVNRFYIGRGENFLMPQHSMHAVSAVRYEIMKVISTLQDDCIKWDTDGIVCKAGKARELLEEINEQIKQRNAQAFSWKKETDCGIWDYEGTGSFMPISAKSYIFKPECKPEVFKHCGISDRDIKEYMQDVSEPAIIHFQQPREIQARAGYIYYSQVHKYKRMINPFTL